MLRKRMRMTSDVQPCTYVALVNTFLTIRPSNEKTAIL
jgi:hypothetical protein